MNGSGHLSVFGGPTRGKHGRLETAHATPARKVKEVGRHIAKAGYLNQDTWLEPPLLNSRMNMDDGTDKLRHHRDLAS